LGKFPRLFKSDRVRKPLTVNIQHYCSSEDMTSGDKSGTASLDTRHVTDAPYPRATPGSRRFGYYNKGKIWYATVRRFSCRLDGYPCDRIAWCVGGCPPWPSCRLARGILERSYRHMAIMLRDHDLSLVSPMCKVSNIRCLVPYSIAIVLVHPISPLSSWDYADSHCS
jgi:hypothetical protein